MGDAARPAAVGVGGEGGAGKAAREGEKTKGDGEKETEEAKREAERETESAEKIKREAERADQAEREARISAQRVDELQVASLHSEITCEHAMACFVMRRTEWDVLLLPGESAELADPTPSPILTWDIVLPGRPRAAQQRPHSPPGAMSTMLCYVVLSKL
eukprot:113355-Rhodomonas_salina.1